MMRGTLCSAAEGNGGGWGALVWGWLWFPLPSLDTGLPAIGNNSLSTQKNMFLTGERSVLLQWELHSYVPGGTCVYQDRFPSFYTASFVHVFTHCSQGNNTRQKKKKVKKYLLLVFIHLYLRTPKTQFPVFFSSEEEKMREYCSYLINRELGGQVGCQHPKEMSFQNWMLRGWENIQISKV